MYEVNVYCDINGVEPVTEYLKNLHDSKNPRDNKQAAKINDYIQVLSLEGKAAGEPYIKHIEGELWELRPARDRIFFVAYLKDTFFLLHPFTKKTQKTPRREIEKAFREIEDLKSRWVDNDK